MNGRRRYHNISLDTGHEAPAYILDILFDNLEILQELRNHSHQGEQVLATECVYSQRNNNQLISYFLKDSCFAVTNAHVCIYIYTHKRKGGGSILGSLSRTYMIITENGAQLHSTSFMHCLALITIVINVNKWLYFCEKKLLCNNNGGVQCKPEK